MSKVLRNRRRSAVSGQAVGILHIDSNYPLLPGNAQNSLTFGFPVRYECVSGLTIPDLLSGAPEAAAKVVVGAQALARAGVRAIVGACGSFANYQTAVAAAVDIPAFMSVLTLVPLVLRGLGRHRRLAIVFASSASFTEKVRRECGINEIDRIIVSDCRELPAFRPILDNKDSLNADALGEQLAHSIARMIERHDDIGCIIQQCSELPPYAAAIQRIVDVPIVDVVTLVEWAHASALRRPYGAAGRFGRE
jgi:hypothetical protein